MDAIGCMIAGTNERATQIVKKYVQSLGSIGSASGIGIKDQLLLPEYADLIKESLTPLCHRGISDDRGFTFL